MDGMETFDRRIVAVRTRFIYAQIRAGHAFLWIAKRDRRVAVLGDARSAYHAAVAELVRIEPALDDASMRSIVGLLNRLAEEIDLWGNV